LKADLQKVAADRGKPYAQKIAILVYWENDNTGAKDDTETMRTVLEGFGIKSIVQILQTTDTIPGLSLSIFIRETLLKYHSPNQNSLFVFYYAGHGTVINGELSFTSARKSVQWKIVHAGLFENLDDLERVDVLGILDCCFAGAATRQQISRTTQILAACGSDEAAKARSGRISFTQRLYRAVQHFKAQASTMTTADLFQEIQRLKPKAAPRAVLKTLGGTQPIRLDFEGAVSSATPSRIPIHARDIHEEHVLVKLTLHGERRHFPEAFTNAIRDLPRNMQVEVTDAYETDQSVFLIMGMSWGAWALWTMVADLDFIGVTIGPSLIHKGLVEVPEAGENLPFRGKGKAE
jgi:hypothetical protein